MPRRLVNDLLLVVLLALALSGVLGWALPWSVAAPWLYDLHRALGVSLLLLLGWKQAIVLGSLRWRLGHADRSIVWGTLAGLMLLLSVAVGLAWTLNVISFDLPWAAGYSPLSAHVALGLGLLPLVGWHALARRRQNRVGSRAVGSRRSLLRLAGLGLASVVGWQVVQRVSALSAPAGTRRASGSKQTTSLSANAYPVEIWLFDSVPALDPATWRLRVSGAAAAATVLSLANLMAYPRRDVQTVLDCTGGWWTEQVWSGPRVLDVLAGAGLPPDAGSVTVSSVTGHTITFAWRDLEAAVLATHVGGEVLSAGHGYPVRLVVPGRRGYQWVKWVAHIDVAERDA